YYLASDTALANPLGAAPVNVGAYVVVASFAGNGTYLVPASASASFQIIGTGLIISESAGNITDTGATLSAIVNPQGSLLATTFQYSTDPTFSPTTTGTPASGIAVPQAVAVDSSGNVFVAGTDGNGNGTVEEIAPGGAPQVITTYYDPSGVVPAVDSSGDVYIMGTDGYSVTEISPDASSRNINFGNPFYSPTRISVDSSGDVFVGDYAYGAVFEYSSSYGDQGEIANGFYIPQGVAVDGNGNVYVADSGTYSLDSVSGGYANPIAWPPYPQGVAVDSNGYIYVADAGYARVDEFDLYGDAIKSFGNDAVINPRGVAVDVHGKIYVTEAGAGVVDEITPDGTQNII